MKITPLGIERLRTLYSVMAGIPNASIELNLWRTEPDDAKQIEGASGHICNTFACVLGWACTYPEFRAAGLKFAAWEPTFKGAYGTAAGVEFFGIENDEGALLFTGRGSGLEKRLSERTRYRMSNKQIALYRIRKALHLAKAISDERNAELAKQEGSPA